MAEFPKIDFKYLKEAFKEPLNFWGMAGLQSPLPTFRMSRRLSPRLAAETLYLSHRASQFNLSSPG